MIESLFKCRPWGSSPSKGTCEESITLKHRLKNKNIGQLFRLKSVSVDSFKMIYLSTKYLTFIR